MSRLWIVHREDRARTALARLAATADFVIGSPSDPQFDAAQPAEIVLLGLAGDWEAELEFAHRQLSRLPDAQWILVGDAAAAQSAHELFDQLPLDFLAYPPRPDVLRRLTAVGASRRPSLSQRARREAAAARFSRWLADLELPEVLRALDPRLAEVPLLVSGEPGTGREALIRYVHHFGGTAEGSLAHVACAVDTSVDEIEKTLAARGRAGTRLRSLCVWLDEVGRLAPRTQRELGAWLEAGPPPGVRTSTLRWVASVDASGPELESALTRALGTLEVALPPLRERVARIEPIVAETAADWARAHRESPRYFERAALDVLEEYPWPGNLRELEAVVEQTLAATARNPLGVDDLQLGGLALAPLDAALVGTLLSDEESAEAGERWAEPSEAVSARVPQREARAVAGPWMPSPIVVEPPVGGEVPAPAGVPEGDAALRRLAVALSQQVRNPLATLRTFAELVPERFNDPDFRSRFAEMVREDVGRIDGLLSRLEQLATLDAPRREKVDVSALLEGLLEERREAFRQRHLLVLKELDSRHPVALADPAQLRLAFEALLDKSLEVVPPWGDVYLASRHHDGGDSGDPTVRVLLRFHDPSAGATDGPTPLERSLELLVAELLVRAQGGRFTLGASEAEERVLVVDLPAP